MNFDSLVQLKSPLFNTIFGISIPVYLHGIFDFSVDAIYNSGGEEIQLASGDVVVTRPSIYIDKTEADKITQEHNIIIDSVEMRIFGEGVPDGTGRTTLTLVKCGEY